MSLKVDSLGEKLEAKLVLLEKKKVFPGMNATGLLIDLAVFIPLCLLLMFEYLLICLGWIMKAT